MHADIFDIQKFSLHDGPGIRTTVFFKGCPLHCIWCHNPESWSKERELLLDRKKCSLCRQCSTCCPGNNHHFDGAVHTIARTRCRQCGLCVQHCPNKALQLSGRSCSTEELLEILLEDRLFYQQSGGGVTFSGGEPLLQGKFLCELLEALRAGNIHCAVETCGMAESRIVKELLDKVDLWLFDCKTPPEDLARYTGGNWQIIEQNLELISRHGTAIILRCPLIPGINNTPRHREFIASLAKRFDNIRAIEIEPYNPLGSGKYDMLDRKLNYSAAMMPEDEVNDFIRELQQQVSQTVRKN